MSTIEQAPLDLVPADGLLVQVFINRVQLICGQPTIVKSEAAEHLWVTKHEIGEYLGDAMGVYLKNVI